MCTWCEHEGLLNPTKMFIASVSFSFLYSQVGLCVNHDYVTSLLHLYAAEAVRV